MSTARFSSSHSQHVLNGRVQRSMEGWSVIERVTDFTHAVCRLTDGRGSAVLVALPEQQSAPSSALAAALGASERLQTGVLLTTSFVLAARETCEGGSVTFLEQPVAGTAARFGGRLDPLTVPLLSERAFACSIPAASAQSGQRAAEAEETEEALGYTMTMCAMMPSPARIGSVTGSCLSDSPTPASSGESSQCYPWTLQSNQTVSIAAASPVASMYLPNAQEAAKTMLSAIKPLPLPLLLSRLAPVQVGDRHMMITHINGMERHYVVQTVKHVGKDSCEYEFFDPASEFSSGGPIFDMRGDFVGLQHQCGDHSYGLFITSIVQHLFQSMLLGIFRLPILERSADGAPEGQFDPNAVVPEEVFNQRFHLNQRYHVLNVGGGDQLIEYEEFKRLRLRKNIPTSLVPPEGQLVWREFYTDFHSLVLILHAFPHSPRLTKLALEAMTNHEHREHLPHFAAMGGVGAVLELIDGYPQNEAIVEAALTVLARTSLYPHNSEAIFRCDGVLTVLEIMNEYSHQPRIQQWGFYCLYNVMATDSPNGATAIDLFVRKQGIDLAVETLRVHENERHVLRHTGFALSCVARADRRHMRRMVRGGVARILFERMCQHVHDPFAFFGLATLLRELLRHVRRRPLSEQREPSVSPSLCTTVTPRVVCLSPSPPPSARGAGERQRPLPQTDGESNASTATNAEDDAERTLLDTLAQGKITATLWTVMERESKNTYSSAAVALLEECVGSLLVLLARRGPGESGEVTVFMVVETCQCIMENFPNERTLLDQADKIVNLLGMA